MILLVVLFFLIIAGVVILNLPVFGRLPDGARAARIHQLPNYRGRALENLSPTPMQPEGVGYLTILKEFFFGDHPNKMPASALEFLTPDLTSIPAENLPEIIWFGHSSYLVKINGLRILVDPIFSKAASPFSFIGSKAFPGTELVKSTHFKDIDVLLITHDHYDHLDYESVVTIAPQAKKIITSVGVGSHLERWGINPNQIIELCWHESINVFNKLTFTAVPARHFTGRKFKRNQTLWSAFVLKSDQHQLFLGGDSGYDSHFREIGKTYGPFDLAVLECGQYNAYWPYIHMFPTEVVKAAIDLQAKALLPVHWGKFSLAMHPWNEPISEVTAAAQEKGMPIVTPRLGESVILGKYMPTFKWWQ
ncbi:MBL fold metallo-hydrolase [Pedobacter sandarakinus]|uniref:MBL fold metallo-hydrolase n=1 Tax=Pedobacter sandarakinus TaxID=353156 RepID=UPI0022466E81|nr:MBL fold metallo-hydrolase [Pedobacter sandarakinus]MCX2574204.1 MBL fold metallo-hydrolase [Pedobacter sandarakinus]